MWVIVGPYVHPTMPFPLQFLLQLQLSQPDHKFVVLASLVATLHAEDQASNLLWRLQNVHVFLKHPIMVAIVLIGTNDLGAGGSCGRGEPGATAAANGTALRSLCCSALCLSVLCLPRVSTQCSVLKAQCSLFEAQCSRLSAQCSASQCSNSVPQSLELCALLFSAQCSALSPQPSVLCAQCSVPSA